MNTIFGYEWDDIHRAQQGGTLHRTMIDTSKPATGPATDADRALLEKHGTIEAIEAAGFYGTADRLRRAG
ncbi:hypothetical protein [Paraburkholderia sp. SIMBA_054]|uniref:hypothetical protein n=1 Tax=Paraburkholderia sp. SIMBA_054 TaxID=3085795 RepID=UPI00397B0EE8